jgi:hypothetical protein
MSAAAQEQAKGIEQINQAVSQMDSVTQQNAALTEEATSASKAIEDQARALMNRIAFFQTGDESLQNTTFVGGQHQPIAPMRFPGDNESHGVDNQRAA